MTRSAPAADPRELVVGPWRLRLQPRPAGLFVSTDDPAVAALCWLLNAAADPASPMAAVVQAGGPFLEQGVLVEPLRDSGAPARSAAEVDFQERAGGPPPPDALLIGVDWRPQATVVSAADLRAALRQLRELRAHYEGPSPGLFTAPGAGDATVDLSDLQRRAVNLDRGVVAAAGRPEHSVLRAERDRILADLERAGLTSEVDAAAKRAWLQAWGFDTLGSLYDAALERQAYAGSSDRAQVVPVSEPVAVSLDAFRHPPTPPDGHTTRSWIAVGEGLLRFAPPSPDDEGSVFAPDPAGMVTLRWRRELGRPCLVALALEGSGRHAGRSGS
jgi:hypothetical protein